MLIGGRSYTRRQFAKAINEETADGIGALGNLISLTIDLLSRNKIASTPAPAKEDSVESAEYNSGVCQECKNKTAVRDYNGHGHYVCKDCYNHLSNEFDEEYK